MYGGDANVEEALAAFGLYAEQPIEEEGTECYPDNWPALQLLRALGTQWRVTERAVVTGLHYECLAGVMDMLQIPHAKRPDTFWALREMELEALTVFNKRTS